MTARPDVTNLANDLFSVQTQKNSNDPLKLNGEDTTGLQNRINNQFGSALGTMKTNADGIVGDQNDNYLLQK
jgi:hypothetical protein